MSHVSFSITDIFNNLFGDGFDPEFDLVVNENENGVNGLARKDFGNVGGSPFYAKDAALGREYYLPVTITYPDESGTASGSVNDAGGGSNTSGEAPVGRLKQWDLPNPVISISSRKTIIETPLTERRGTVKELINIQDYEIVIRGKIIGASKEFPETIVAQLAGIYELNVSVGISSPITDIFLLRPDRSGSDQAVIREIRFPEMRGVKNVKDYELVLISDEPFNLIDIT